MPEPYEIYPKSSSTTFSEKSADAMQVVPIDIGMMGFSLEDIAKGQKGWCRMPLGVRDSTKWGGRKFVRIKMTGMENVRANRDIIVGNEQGEVKEHTPVELSYEKHPSGSGTYQRVGEDYPLPVTNGSRAVTMLPAATCSAAGNTQLIAGQTSKKIRVHYFSISNMHAVAATVGFRIGSSADVIHEVCLPASGGTMNANLLDCVFETRSGEALNAWLNAAYAGGVLFNVGYTLEDA